MVEIDATKSTPEVTTKGGSILDSLRQELEIKIHKDPLILVVPERPSVKVAFDVNIESSDLENWRKGSRLKANTKDESFDILKFSSIIIGNTAEAIYFEDEMATEKDGSPLTFRSVSLMEMFGVPTPRLAVKSMYGLDGHIMQVAAKIINSAGYDETELEGDEGTGFLG